MYNLTLVKGSKKPILALKALSAVSAKTEWHKLILEEEIFYRTKEGLDPRTERQKAISLFRLRPSQALSLLQKGQILKVLCWNNLPLIADFFTPFRLKISANNQVFLSAPGVELEVDKSLTFLPGPPHFVIKNNFLRTLDESIPWDIIECIQNDLDIEKIRKIAREMDEVQIEIAEAVKTTPGMTIPKLILTDSTFAFANLAQNDRTWEKDLLEAGFQKKTVGSSNYFCPLDKVLETIQFLLELGWLIETIDKKILVPITDTSLKASEKEQVIEISGTVSFGSHTAPLADTLKALSQGQKTYPLDGTHTGFLKSARLQNLSAIAQELEFFGGNATLPKIKQGLLEELLPKTERKIERVLLSDFSGTLRPYQEEGVSWLLHLQNSSRSGLLADEMGLGKTVQMLAFLSHLKGQVLIVVPTSLIPNWASEAQKFTPNRFVHRYEGPNRSLENLPDNSLIITSYALARLDVEKLKQRKFSLVILDEAQMIKNSRSQTFQALQKIPSSMRVLLTGTPIENSLDDLVTLFSYLEPELIQTPSLPQIKKLIKPYLLRRTKEQVLPDLPPLQEQTVLIEMDEEQQILYDSFILALKEGLVKKVQQDGISHWRMEVLEAILRLRQIACHPALIPAFREKNCSSSKFDLIKSDIETLLQEKKKVLLFSQFASVIHLLSKDISAPHLLLTGESTNRETIVKSFTDKSGPNLLLATLKTGGVGLNLQAADSVLLFDPWWNGAVEAQAIGRAHRIGRMHPVFATRYIVQNSIEEQIQQIRMKKEGLQKAIFSSSDEYPDDISNELFFYLLD